MEAILKNIPMSPGRADRGSRLAQADVPSLIDELERLFARERVYLDQDICLDELARRLGLTPHAFSELLNRWVGVSYYEYVSRWRVAEACRLLTEPGTDTILQIGLKSGFRSKVAFHEAFRLFTGMSPGEYKKKAQQSVREETQIHG